MFNKIYKLTVNPISQKKINDKEHKKYEYNFKVYSRPKSMIIVGNTKYYNLLFSNCVQLSAYYLKYGKLKGNDYLFKLMLYNVIAKGNIPNLSYNWVKPFGTEVITH